MFKSNIGGNELGKKIVLYSDVLNPLCLLYKYTLKEQTYLIARPISLPDLSHCQTYLIARHISKIISLVCNQNSILNFVLQTFVPLFCLKSVRGLFVIWGNVYPRNKKKGELSHNRIEVPTLN